MVNTCHPIGEAVYHDCKEGVGGVSVELSVMLGHQGVYAVCRTDRADKRRDFGSILDVMATVIQGRRGPIDKYIGEAVMAFGNAPRDGEDHSNWRVAPRAMSGRLAGIIRSPGLGRGAHFVTRFGLHCCVASWDFSAPIGQLYAIGDGINLASRLEALNNRYGTTIIARREHSRGGQGKIRISVARPVQ